MTTRPTGGRGGSARVGRRRAVIAVLVTLFLLLLTACAAGRNPESVASLPDRAGFWAGLWQGFITPVTLIVSLFTDTVSVYEVRNKGNWYDVGYVLGVAIVFGSVLGGPGRVSARPRRRDPAPGRESGRRRGRC